MRIFISLVISVVAHDFEHGGLLQTFKVDEEMKVEMVISADGTAHQDRDSSSDVELDIDGHQISAEEAESREKDSKSNMSMKEAWMGFDSAKSTPTHEKMVLASLKASGLLPPSDTSAPSCPSTSASEYFRGVLYNDDPLGLLFSDKPADGINATCFCDTDGYCSGLGAAWGWDFTRDWCKDVLTDPVANGKPNWYGFEVKWPRTYMCHSHFGNLQFLHSMSLKSNVPARDSQRQALAWAQFAYKVALGELTETDKVSQGMPGVIARLFRQVGLPRGTTVKHLFSTDDQGKEFSGPSVNIQRRAIGSLAHMLQDSLGPGHTGRSQGGTGPIKQFRDYSAQTQVKDGSSIHKDYDLDPADVISNRRLFKHSVKMTTALFRFYKRKAPWSKVKRWLIGKKSNLLRITPDALPSGAGQTKYTVTFDPVDAFKNASASSGLSSLDLKICFKGGVCSILKKYGPEGADSEGSKGAEGRAKRKSTTISEVDGKLVVQMLDMDFGCLKTVHFWTGQVENRPMFNSITVSYTSKMCRKKDQEKKFRTFR